MQHCAKAITGENNQLNKIHIILLFMNQSSVRAKRIRFIRDLSYIFRSSELCESRNHNTIT